METLFEKEEKKGILRKEKEKEKPRKEKEEGYCIRVHMKATLAVAHEAQHGLGVAPIIGALALTAWIGYLVIKRFAIGEEGRRR